MVGWLFFGAKATATPEVHMKDIERYFIKQAGSGRNPAVQLLSELNVNENFCHDNGIYIQVDIVIP